MAISANFGVSFDQELGTSVGIFDCSELTDGSIISDIKAVRFMFGAYNKVAEASDVISDLKAWTEYTVNQDCTINGRALLSGEKVYLAEDYTLEEGETATETGFYGERIEWLPTGSDPVVYFSPSQTGYTTSDTIFTDNAFSLVYEIYSTVYTSGTVPAGKYIVAGTPGETIQIGDGAYYVGEVFEKATSFTFSTGGAYVIKQDSYLEGSFFTFFNAYSVLENYLDRICNPFLVTNMQKLQYDFLQVNGLYQSLITMGDRSYDVSTEEIQTILNQIDQFWSQLASVT